jgi:hypothetical protein
MRSHDSVLMVLFAHLNASCGTSLQVCGAERGITRPSGVVVNQRQRLSGTVAVAADADEMAPRLAPGTVDLIGVDPLQVLDIDVSRSLFASGKLVLELDDRQVVTKLGIVSTPGAETFVKVINAGVDTAAKIREERKDDP